MVRCLVVTSEETKIIKDKMAKTMYVDYYVMDKRRFKNAPPRVRHRYPSEAARRAAVLARPLEHLEVARFRLLNP